MSLNHPLSKHEPNTFQVHSSGYKYPLWLLFRYNSADTFLHLNPAKLSPPPPSATLDFWPPNTYSPSSDFPWQVETLSHFSCHYSSRSFFLYCMWHLSPIRGTASSLLHESSLGHLPTAPPSHSTSCLVCHHIHIQAKVTMGHCHSQTSRLE